MNKPRRPAQLDDAQIEAIQGDSDVAYNSELAHTSAQALMPMGKHFREDNPEIVARVLRLVDDEGCDVLAESWVRSPEDSLPGILWRGYLLREWIRREADVVATRYQMVRAVLGSSEDEAEQSRLAQLPKPGCLRQEWDLVLMGTYECDFADLLARSARFTKELADIDAVWISEDSHPLATEVTRRHAAMAQTAREFAHAARLAAAGALE